MAAEIIQLFHKLEGRLRCPPIIEALPRDYLSGVQPRDVRYCDLLATTAKRLYKVVVPLAKKRFGHRLAHVPWTPEEAKGARKKKFREDENVVMDLLAMLGSGACSIYRTIGLNRELVKSIYRRLQSDRSRQVVFSSIVCATRFKM